ncbi:MAG: AtpZ/AtpI family protein [Elusimicrobia bacterium]|nr:AtpZ/AtpI family protein [Elusimicrobiota bacterium]
MQSTQNPWTRLLGVGLNLTVTILLGFFVGYWIDRKLGTRPWLMLLGAGVGMIVGFYQFIKESLKD